MTKYDVVVYEDIEDIRHVRGRVKCVAETAEIAGIMTLATYCPVRFPLLKAHVMISPYTNRGLTDEGKEFSSEL